MRVVTNTREAAASIADEVPRGRTAQLSARYRNFLTPLLTLFALGGLPALQCAAQGGEGAGWWPVVWLAAAFAAVFFSAAFMAMAGRRKLPVAYGIALGAAVGLAMAAYGLLIASAHVAGADTAPAWLQGTLIRRLVDWRWAPLLPYAAGLAVHGLALVLISRKQPPESRG